MKFIYYNLLALFLIFGLSCSTDNPNNNNDNNLNTVNCKVSGDLNLNFKSSSATYIKYETGQSFLFAEMHLNPNETYSMQIKFNDKTGSMSFDLSGSEPLTKFARNNMTTNIITYSSNVTGNISFTDKGNDSLRGTFNYSASFIDTVNSVTKTINISDGNFVINKITK
jgi:hypothetical protein